MSDPTIEALRRLVTREGGHIAVADAIGANDQSIYQIVSGVKLPSGEPKGVGASLRKRLSARYPDWLTETESGTSQYSTSIAAPQDLPALLRQLGLHLANMEPERRAELADLMAAWVKGAGKPSYETLVAECIATPAAPPEKRQDNG